MPSLHVRLLIPIFLASIVLVATATPARADLTGFIGVTTTPSSRTNGGFSAGTGFLIVAFEFEYAATKENLNELTEEHVCGCFREAADNWTEARRARTLSNPAG